MPRGPLPSSTRRQFLAGIAPVFLRGGPPRDKFRLWVFGDAHVGTDLRFGRHSLAEAIADSESAFDWDLAIDIGDMSGAESNLPNDDEGREVITQFQNLRRHRREQIYNVSGNHDRSGGDEPEGRWWHQWVDPLGENTSSSGVDAARRPYPAQGTWERYSFRVGNVLFLMMSDRNEPSRKVDRARMRGNPGGVVAAETWDWWRETVEDNAHAMIVSVHHYMLKNTTVASGDWEGCTMGADGQWQSHYHNCTLPGATSRGASYLYWVGGKQDSQAFEGYLAKHPGAVSLWLGGHTHTNPDDTYGHKSHFERKWGTWFLNAAQLTRYHVSETSVPMSRLLTFTQGSNEVLVQCYLHSSDYAPRDWYPKVERRIRLSRPFRA